MTATRNLTLALGLAAILAAPALAQRQGGPGQGGAGRFGQGGPGMGMQGSPIQLLMAPPVQEELGLSEEQVEKLRPIGDRLREDMMGRLRDAGDLDPEERRERFEAIAREANEKTREELEDILKEEQLTRLDQLQLQQQGVQAFASPRVAEELKLDDEQKSRIDDILASYRDETRSVMETARDADGRREAMGRLNDLRGSTLDKAMAVLTDDQRSTWKELAGEPFEMGPGGPGGGRGGFGPGGRGGPGAGGRGGPGAGAPGRGGRPGGRGPGQN